MLIKRYSASPVQNSPIIIEKIILHRIKPQPHIPSQKAHLTSQQSSYLQKKKKKNRRNCKIHVIVLRSPIIDMDSHSGSSNILHRYHSRTPLSWSHRADHIPPLAMTFRSVYTCLYVGTYTHARAHNTRISSIEGSRGGVRSASARARFNRDKGSPRAHRPRGRLCTYTDFVSFFAMMPRGLVGKNRLEWYACVNTSVDLLDG